MALLQPEAVQEAARELLTELRRYEVDPVLGEAATIGTGILRSLDAIHLTPRPMPGSQPSPSRTRSRRTCLTILPEGLRGTSSTMSRWGAL